MSEKKSIIQSFVHIGVGTFLNMLIGFITTPIITRLVLPAEYGRLSIFNLYINIAVMVLCLGLDQSLVRYYYKTNDIVYKSILIRKCSLIPFLLSVLVPLLVFFSMNLLGVSFEFADVWIPLVLGIVGHMIFRYSILVLRLEGKSKSYAKVNVINKSLFAAAAILIAIIFDNRSFSVLAFSTVFAIIIASIIGISEMRDLWFKRNKTILSNSSGVDFKELVRYGLPFILAMGLTTLFEAIDKLSLNKYCDYSTVGIYTGAINIVNVFAIIQTTFNTLWAPVSIKHYEENPDDKDFYSNFNITITFIMFLFGFSLILFKDVFGLMLGQKYREAAFIIPFLTFHPIMYTISETTITGVVVKKKSYIHILTAGISCLINLIGNTLLVPALGARGAAFSTGISYIVFWGLRTAFGMKYFNFDIKLLRLTIVILLLIVYSLYNSFYRFGVISLILYIISVSVLLYLYRATFIKILLSIKKLIFKMK